MWYGLFACCGCECKLCKGTSSFVVGKVGQWLASYNKNGGTCGFPVLRLALSCCLMSPFVYLCVVSLSAVQIRKYPVFYQPWQHVFFAGVGAWAGEALVDWTERSTKEVDEILKQRAEANKNI